MKIARKSYFKNPAEDHKWFRDWVGKLESLNGRKYEDLEIQTSLGKTQVWGINTEKDNTETIVIFPGYRTSSLFWDLDGGLSALGENCSIYLVETNGQPNLSDGNTPDIKSLDYGVWATEVLDALKIEKTYIAGASFGGLISMKLAIVSPERVKAAILLNPGCFQSFSLGMKNLYYNILPIVKTNERTVSKFLDNVVFGKPVHQLSEQAEKLLIDFEVYVIRNYKDKGQKPYDMKDQLAQVESDVYFLLGDCDILFPYQKTIVAANKYLKKIKDVHVFPSTGHGIETHHLALKKLGEIINCK